jgi:hypothetical protein
MIRRIALLPIGTTTAIALAIGVGAQAADAATQAPFKGVYTGSFVPTDTGFSVGGSGRATTLGNSDNQGTVVIRAQPNPTCPTTGFVVTNDEVLTAANGDRIALSILDMPCPVADEPGIYDGVSTYHITGGTGRFAGATGEGTFDGRGDFTDPYHLTFTYTFDGTISVANQG